MADRPLLVVTDEARLRAEVTDGAPAGFALHVAGDAREASALMTSLTPAVVVVDIRMGSAGGVALAHDMAQVVRLANVPIIMLLERPQDEWLARSAGARIVRTRPITAERLAQDIRSLVPN